MLRRVQGVTGQEPRPSHSDPCKALRDKSKLLNMSRIFVLRGLPLIVSVLCFWGCSSPDKTSDGSFASVIVVTQSPNRIREVMEKVFSEAGYQLMAGNELIFEKNGSQMDQIVHGGWLDDVPVRQRVRAHIVRLSDSTHRLQCTAYMVENAGDLRFENEKRRPNFRGGPYQALLDKVAAELR